MATGKRGGAGIKNRNIGESAGIRPYKLDLVYASETAFLADKDTGNENASTAEEGDWFYDSTTNSFKVHNGSQWEEYLSASSLTGDVSVTAAGATTVTDLTMSGEAEDEILEFDGTNWVSVAVSGDLTQANGAFTIADSVLDGSNVANTADANEIGGVPVMFRIDTTGGSSGTETVNTTMTHKVLVTDVWVQANGSGFATSDTVQVLSTGNAITEAIDVSGAADTDITRATKINDANATIAASGVLRVQQVDASGSDTPACTVYVLGLRVA